MTSFVLACSVAMAWCFDEEGGDYALEVLDSFGRRPAVVQAIWPFEVANVLLVAERKRRLSRADAARTAGVELYLNRTGA